MNFSNVYHSTQLIHNFEEILDNFFRFLFEATKNPQDHPELDFFLQHVTAFFSDNAFY